MRILDLWRLRVIRRRRLAPNQRGFTLIEVMIVVAIIGILAAVIVPRVIDRPDTARIVKVRQDLRAIESALKLYRLDNFAYPTTEQGLAALVTRPQGAPEPPAWQGYLDRLPRDPWGNAYHYRSPGEHGEIDVFSLGADNAPGGAGIDADVGNWAPD